MRKAPILFLAATLGGIPAGMFAQSQSPDQQQETRPKPTPKANQPESDTAQPQTGQSPDIQQEKNGSTTGTTKHAKKSKNNARQGHGTPKPKSGDTATSH